MGKRRDNVRRRETCFATTETNVAFCSRFSVCAYNSHQDTSMNCRYRCRCNPNRTCEHKATSPASHKFCCTVDRAETFADSPKTLSCLWLFSSCPMTTESGQQQLEPQQWTGSAWFVVGGTFGGTRNSKQHAKLARAYASTEFSLVPSCW